MHSWNVYPSTLLRDGITQLHHIFFHGKMCVIAGKLKTGKSTNSFLKAEHIMHGSPKLMIHIHLLFNAFIQHGFVPTDFLKGIIRGGKA